MPRLFTAIKIPNEIANILAIKQGGIRNARWIEKEDFHITICFIGDVEQHIAEQILLALERVKFEQPMEIEIIGFDIFGHKKPRALIANIKHNLALDELRKATQHQLQLLGLMPETRKFIPHITIARFTNSGVKNTYDKINRTNEIANYLSRNVLQKPLCFRVDNFCLMSAKPSIGGGPYVAERCYY